MTFHHIHESQHQRCCLLQHCLITSGLCNFFLYCVAQVSGTQDGCPVWREALPEFAGNIRLGVVILCTKTYKKQKKQKKIGT
jgi:hypothetical protein